MSEESKEYKIKGNKFLGSSRNYWHGNSTRIALPADAVEELNLKRGTGKIFKGKGEVKQFLVFDTDKGILFKPIDNQTEKKLKDVFQFNNISKLSEEDLKVLFSELSKED